MGRKFLISFIFSVILTFSTIPTVSLAMESGEEKEIVLTFRFSDPEIEKWNFLGTDFEKMTIDGCVLTELPLLPRIPIKFVKVLLPPGYKIKERDITLEDKMRLGEILRICRESRIDTRSLLDFLEIFLNSNACRKDIRIEVEEGDTVNLGIHPAMAFSLAHYQLTGLSYIDYPIPSEEQNGSSNSGCCKWTKQGRETVTFGPKDLMKGNNFFNILSMTPALGSCMTSFYKDEIGLGGISELKGKTFWQLIKEKKGIIFPQWFPPSPRNFTYVGVQYKRGFPILFLYIHPIRYNIYTGETIFYKKITVRIRLERDTNWNLHPLFRGFKRDFDTVERMVDNPSVIVEYYPFMNTSATSKGKLAIITSSGSHLSEIKSWWGSRYPCEIKTLEEIAQEYGDFSFLGSYYRGLFLKDSALAMSKLYTPSSSKNKERIRELHHEICRAIREYIKDAYKRGVDYVLFVGDDDSNWGALTKRGHFSIYASPEHGKNWSDVKHTSDLIVSEGCHPPAYRPNKIYAPVYQLQIGVGVGDTPLLMYIDNVNGEGNLAKKVDGRINITLIERERLNPADIGKIREDRLRNLPVRDISSSSRKSGGRIRTLSSFFESSDSPSGDKRANITKPTNSNPYTFNGTVYHVNVLGAISVFPVTTASDLTFSCLDDEAIDTAPSTVKVFLYETNWGVERVNNIKGKALLSMGISPFNDLLSEVYVGRLPISKVQDIRFYIQKEKRYLSATYRDYNKVLMLSEYLGFTGETQFANSSLEELINSTYKDGYLTYGIPENNSTEETLGYVVEELKDSYQDMWNGSDVIRELNKGEKGYALVEHLGHSCQFYNMKMFVPEFNLNDEYHYVIDEGYRHLCVDNLHNKLPFVVYSQGCFAGAFDWNESVAEWLLFKTHGGAIAGIWNTYFGFGYINDTDGPSQRYAREFVDAIFGEDYKVLSEAFVDSKEDNVGRVFVSPVMRILYYGIEYLGDPLLKIKYEKDTSSVNLDNPALPSLDDTDINREDNHTDKGGETTNFSPSKTSQNKSETDERENLQSPIHDKNSNDKTADVREDRPGSRFNNFLRELIKFLLEKWNNRGKQRLLSILFKSRV